MNVLEKFNFYPKSGICRALIEVHKEITRPFSKISTISAKSDKKTENNRLVDVLEKLIFTRNQGYVVL